MWRIEKFLSKGSGLNCFIGKPELPRQPGSTAQYEAEASQLEQSSESAPTDTESPHSSSTDANNFFHSLDWKGTGFPLKSLCGLCLSCMPSSECLSLLRQQKSLIH